MYQYLLKKTRAPFSDYYYFFITKSITRAQGAVQTNALSST